MAEQGSSSRSTGTSDLIGQGLVQEFTTPQEATTMDVEDATDVEEIVRDRRMGKPRSMRASRGNTMRTIRFNRAARPAAEELAASFNDTEDKTSAEDAKEAREAAGKFFAAAKNVFDKSQPQHRKRIMQITATQWPELFSSGHQNRNEADPQRLIQTVLHNGYITSKDVQEAMEGDSVLADYPALVVHTNLTGFWAAMGFTNKVLAFLFELMHKPTPWSFTDFVSDSHPNAGCYRGRGQLLVLDLERLPTQHWVDRISKSIVLGLLDTKAIDLYKKMLSQTDFVLPLTCFKYEAFYSAMENDAELLIKWVQAYGMLSRLWIFEEVVLHVSSELFSRRQMMYRDMSTQYGLDEDTEDFYEINADACGLLYDVAEDLRNLVHSTVTNADIDMGRTGSRDELLETLSRCIQNLEPAMNDAWVAFQTWRAAVPQMALYHYQQLTLGNGNVKRGSLYRWHRHYNKHATAGSYFNYKLQQTVKLGKEDMARDVSCIGFPSAYDSNTVSVFLRNNAELMDWQVTAVAVNDKPVTYGIAMRQPRDEDEPDRKRKRR